MPDDDHTLERFISAQEIHYEQALLELTEGHKYTHWSWFIIPQLRGLARSHRAHFYGIADLSEAILYAEHPNLGPRLETCFKAILRHPNVEIRAILGETDARKLKSCATLFSHTVLRDSALELLAVFYAGERCAQSEELLARDH